MSAITCKNCDEHFEGNFCPRCGQPAKVHRVNAAYFLHDIPHSVLHVDKGFFYTFSQLFRRPGEALKEYLEGKRIDHYRPFAYVLMLSAICSLLIHWNSNLIHHLHQEKTLRAVPVPEQFFAKYPSAFIFLMIPLVSLCTWLVFLKRRYNFWEHMLVNTYISAQLNVLLVLIHLFALIKYLITGTAQYNFAFFITIFMTGFMTYYATAFSTLMKTDEPSYRLGLKLALMCFILSSIYSTGMAFTRIASAG